MPFSLISTVPVGAADEPVTTTVAVVTVPNGAEFFDSVSAVVEPDFLMSTGTTADVDGAYSPLSGVKVALSECDPAPSFTFAVALPPVTADEPISVCPVEERHRAGGLRRGDGGRERELLAGLLAAA